ncbi:MAG: hypothetical protein ACOY4D_01320 [Pseudomonadota bacterium]|nr:hypothetical protein [Gammaproteobacteria bacterium]
MKEILIYGFVAISSLLLWTFVVHMMVGGLVSQETEHMLMGGAVVLWALVIGGMTWDVLRRRRKR